MTEYINRIAFMAPVEHVDACNRVANALGRNGLNFAVRLSTDGLEPATHIGGSAVETEDFLIAITLASRHTPEAESLLQEDWDVVADDLLFTSGKAGTVQPLEQFEKFVSDLGLKRILPKE